MAVARIAELERFTKPARPKASANNDQLYLPELIDLGLPFLVAETELTLQTLKWFLTDTRYQLRGPCRISNGNKWRNKPNHHALNSGAPADDNYPATCLNFGEAKAVASWLSKQTGQTWRIPSGEEWTQIATSARSTLISFRLDEHANYSRRLAGRKPALLPVKSLRPSDAGIYDVFGNVWEWTTECDGQKNRKNCSKRILRGGAWDTPEKFLRTVGRKFAWSAAGRLNYAGVRYVVDR